MLKKVVFLDRDGVINRDSPDYIKSWPEFEFLPGSLEAIRELTDHGYTLIVITNQSAIGRGFISVLDLEDMHRKMAAAIRRAGGDIDGVFYCPHTPQARCTCRKPLPGMIHQACRRFPIDLRHAVMVGDSPRDISCGRAAGCGRTVLITGEPTTGDGQPAPGAEADADFAAASLLDSVEWILADRIEHP
jgi:D-glycero-D-manno-heptose 1,7-bisphosphate phosphatase